MLKQSKYYGSNQPRFKFGHPRMSLLYKLPNAMEYPIWILPRLIVKMRIPVLEREYWAKVQNSQKLPKTTFSQYDYCPKSQNQLVRNGIHCIKLKVYIQRIKNNMEEGKNVANTQF